MRRSVKERSVTGGRGDLARGRTSENPLAAKFAERPFHALGCIGLSGGLSASNLPGGSMRAMGGFIAH